MGIRIKMENDLDDVKRRLLLVEGAVEDLLNIYKENKDGKKNKEPKQKISKKKSK